VITSRDNETLKLVRKLLGQRKHREETGLFAVEGEDLVAAAREAGIQPVHLLVAGETVEAELLARVSTLPHPARAIGVYRRADLAAGGRDTCLALWRLADPGNVGTLVRTADAFGACVALSDGCADPLVKLSLMKASYLFCMATQIRWMVIGARNEALVRQYRMLGFKDVFDDGRMVPLRHAGRLDHRVLAFNVTAAERMWREPRHPLYEFIFETSHPDIQLFSTQPALPKREPARPGERASILDRFGSGVAAGQTVRMSSRSALVN